MNRFKSLYITIALVVHLLSVMSCVRIGCIQGNCINGQGTYTNADGDKYVGEWKEGERNGQGTYTTAGGKVQRGMWENGKLVE